MRKWLFADVPTLNTLYRSHLELVFNEYTTKEHLLKLLELTFSKLHLNMDFNSSCSSLQLHSFNLQLHYQFYISICDDNVCVSCLTSKPADTLSYGHRICEICIYNFGILIESYNYILQNCILCNKNITFKISPKPPMAGIQVLCMDGGGIRGVVPLLALREVEKPIGLPCKLQEHFDLVVGTSSGIISIISLFNRK